MRLKYLLFVFLIFISCSLDFPIEENDLLRWTTILEIPLSEQKVDLGSLSENSEVFVKPLDDYFSDGSSEDSIFVYKKTIDIENVEVGNKLEIDPISINFTQSVDDVNISSVGKIISSQIGIIRLDDIEESDVPPFIFRDIYPDIENIENGLSTSIPAFELLPITNPFSFDNFANAEFSSGYLKVTISNGMPISLGPPLVIQLQTLNELDTIDILGATLEFDTSIEENGGSVMDSLDLTGMILPGDVFVKVIGNCQGTSGAAINIDESVKNSSFVVTISAENLEIISAEAKIPEQKIEESGVITLEPDSNKVTRATIQNGILDIEIDNYMEMASNLFITIPSIETPEGSAFQIGLDIGGSIIGLNHETNMEGHVIVMSKDTQEINYNYIVLTIDTEDEFISIASEDSIVVRISLNGQNLEDDISFSQFQGFLDQDAMVDSNIIELETPSKVDIATIASGNLELSIINGLGISAFIDFTINELRKHGEKLETSFALPIDEPLNIIIDLEGYELNPNLELDPQIINYVSRINIPSDEEISLNFNQKIEIGVLMDSLFFSDISGYIDPIDIEIDSIKQVIDLPSELDSLEFSQIQLNFSFRSNLSLPILLNLELLSANDETGETYSKSISGINIIETPEFIIEDLQGLINIKPNSVIAYGVAQIGSLTEYGSVTTEDTLSGSFNILAPLAFEINNESKINLESQLIDSLNMIDEIQSLTLYMEYDNNFEFGTDATILIAQDTNNFKNGLADTLTRVVIQPDSLSLDSIELDEDSFNLLSRDSNYIKTILKIKGKESSGPVRFLSTDTLNMKLYMKAEVIIEAASVID